MNAKEAAELLDVIADRAPGLAERGVRRVELGAGVGFTLVDLRGPEASAGATPADDEPPPDALHDPWAFGPPPAGSPRVRAKLKRPPLVGLDE